MALMQLENGLEYINTDWSAGYPSQFLNAGRREAAFRSVIGQRFSDLSDQLKPDHMLHVEASQSKITIPSVAAPDKLPANLDTTVLLLLHYHPDLQDGLNWAALALLRARYEIDMRHQHAPALWGSFFPEDVYPEQIPPSLVKAFRDWTRVRAQRLPAAVVMYLQPHRTIENGRSTLELFAGRSFSYNYVNFSSTNISEKNLLGFPVSLPLLEVQQTGGAISLSHFGLLLNQPVSSYLWPLSPDQDREVTALGRGTSWWTPGGDVKLVVQGVRIESKQGLLLVEVRPTEFQMVNNQQPVFTLRAPAEK